MTCRRRAAAVCLAAMCFAINAESGQAGCPTIDDVRADGVWVTYAGTLVTVHYVATGPSLLTETQYNPRLKLLKTKFADGIYPLEVFEYDQTFDKAILIGTFEYRDLLALPKLRAEETLVVEVERHLTDEALTGQPRRLRK